ncbi:MULTISPECIES: rhamnose ABC transporter substrate-binding protein [Paenarthrobacter]|jgi:rhamnose transport system substrate-binding protein|uniref:rhamnose ABC transporter substrate-binding protein n=1 Tax=Paenarthrobacter TaxID=1742992 RepID=UPI00140AD6EC|nr:MULTISPECIES: rhamnose ABC transporter substrate-binding protein [Paenarthrobacter]MCW3765287.1 rhamnose ABC transporter substrate-binding protein [Paenarthrobacter sp. PAE-2]MCX8453460.1 rhamnose ABC transporter substrate-binding protein [Paenarthrobacter ureafaciens]MCY0973119.1 rhamnose ABC transporter substrate-binding protein [Paenarthrobacter ureafaciens]QOT17327.1 rhamnose ABC transporter substrate-binding protein [Paenarthrobacter sp. YJN-5]QQQ63981.1 rhamnose ABC transporter substr
MRTTTRAALSGVAAIGLASLALTACTPAGGGAANAGECTPKDNITVGYIPKLGDDPYMTTVRDGAQKAAAELGGSNKVVYTSPSEATGAAQIPFVQQLISQKVDVIAISGSDLNGAAAELKKAQAQGIKVITFDSDVAPEARSLFVNQAKTEELGTGMLDSMSDLLGGQGEFAILSSTQTAVNQNAWIADIKKRLESESKFSGMKLVDVVYGEEKADVSANRAKELVTTHPNLKGIIVPAGISLPAAATALDEIGALGKVKLTGLAPASLIRKHIETGNVQDIWWNVSDLGYLSFYAAKAVAGCSVTGKAGETFDAGTLGSYTVGEQNVVILGPAKTVTPANVSEFAF